ncbi:probable salivary secreted peptide [Drosophila bipectinata]|uniref:probable salivary secreted peptide n=1 Tax=Drosophila bipectinata TaxID=42026 RepID=UPI0007E8AF0E|nr:uncharacterized protein LOC108133769 [Drosophila bipectinata]KAH8272966.1 hypothetical protein KR026_002737 [Drosophila bipectinata]
MYLCSVVLILLSTTCSIYGLGGSGGEGNDYTYGSKATTDTLIARETITKSKMLLQTVTKTYTLTQAGTAKTITYIQITDLKRMRGASAEITSGGVGSTTVTIKFTSARGAGIKSQIEIWGST